MKRMSSLIPKASLSNLLKVMALEASIFTQFVYVNQ